MTTKLISVTTGAFPTAAPTHADLLGKVLRPDSRLEGDVDVKVIVSAATGTVTLCGWDDVSWCPIGDLSLDVAV